MIRKLMIANRGEIACRIIRTCRQMGIATVAVYSDADAHALHVEMADEAVYIGLSPAPESYLHIERIIAAAQRTQANAIHPGYGFLAENAAFAQAVQNAGLIFVGPTPDVIKAMGDKGQAKRLLQDVPFVPGYFGDDQSDDTLRQAADDIGYPIMIKATAGGGGKGMRQVNRADDLPQALAAARREAQQAFGDDTLMLEKALLKPRHIEVQILGDHHGNVIALGERECSIQRRHQKIIEEAPSSALNNDQRRELNALAERIAQQLTYTNAGTIEFLYDQDGQFYFMEMNTRLQVEHPVTEMITGWDLVAWQIKIAEGEHLPAEKPALNGHAIEVRIYAEDPANQFLPATGTLYRWHTPSSVRVDAGIRTGDAISAYYDPMIAKIIAHGPTRRDAIRQLDYALAQTHLFGLRNNISFLRRVLMHPAHLSSDISTRFLDENATLLPDTDASPYIALMAAALRKSGGQSHWRNNPNRPIRQQFKHGDSVYTVDVIPQKSAYRVQIGDDTYQVALLPALDGDTHTLIVDGHRQTVTIVCHDTLWWVHHDGQTHRLDWLTPLPQPGQSAAAEGSLRAPMPGQVIQVSVQVAQTVQQGDLLLIMEAMKMEHRIEAPYAGRVDALHYQVGDAVQADAVLLELTPLET